MTRLPLLAPGAAAPAPAWQVASWADAEGPDLDAVRGRVVLVLAFQVGCRACADLAVPQAVRLHRELDPAEVVVLGLHCGFEERPTPTALAAFLLERDVRFPVGIDRPVPGRAIPATMAGWDLPGTPSLVAIDRLGRLRGIAFGTPPDEVVHAAVRTLVAEP